MPSCDHTRLHRGVAHHATVLSVICHKFAILSFGDHNRTRRKRPEPYRLRRPATNFSGSSTWGPCPIQIVGSGEFWLTFCGGWSERSWRCAYRALQDPGRRDCDRESRPGGVAEKVLWGWLDKALTRAEDRGPFGFQERCPPRLGPEGW